MSYLDEIHEQPGMLQALAKGLPIETVAALGKVRVGLRGGRYDRVLITAMGGSLHGAYPAFLTLSGSLTLPVLLQDASELVQQIPKIITPQTLLIVISQSGESGEIVELTKLPRPATVISVSNRAGNTLANWSDIAVFSNAGPELTVSTKSYTGGLAGLHLVVNALIDADAGIALSELTLAAEAAERLLADWEPAIAAVSAVIDANAPLVYVARGASLGSAAIAALLTHEAAKLQAVALSGGQFRHGPIELVRPGFQMIIFLGDEKTRAIDLALIDKVTGAGGRVTAVCPASSALSERDRLHVYRYPDVPADLRPIMEALFVQLIQIPLCAARGLKVGEFVNATKITGVT